MGLRRIARECALQMLYEFDVGKHSKDEILQTFWQMNEQPRKVGEFANQLFEGTVQRLKEIDRIIQLHTKNWRLGRIFRNEGISAQHNPEFTMLEFYQAYSDYGDLMDLSQEMITQIAEAVTGTRQVKYREHIINPASFLPHCLKRLQRISSFSRQSYMTIRLRCPRYPRQKPTIWERRSHF